MALFKILKGDSSRISMDVTPFHDGYAYFTPDDGGFYIDSTEDGENKRIRVTSPGSGGSKAVYGTLLADGWSSGQQTLTVSAVAADTNGVIGVTHDITDEQLDACGNAGMYVCGQGDGYLTVAISGDTPTCDIPVVIILLS